MRNHRLLLFTALLAAACSSSSTNPPAGPSGSVKFGVKSKATAATAISLPPLCPHFSLTPYSISNGTYSAAGSAIEIDSAHPGQTEFIAGCTDTSDNTAPAANDWSYSVVANNYAFCGITSIADLTAQGYTDLADYLAAHSLSLADFLASMTPDPATAQVDFNCIAGQDVDADISVDVNVPLQSNAGYVDISVSVNATPVTVGCKMADADSHDPSTLNFGSSWDVAQPTPNGLWGVLDPLSGAVHQYTSVVHAGQTNTQTYAGSVHMTDQGQVHLVQTAIPGCDSANGEAVSYEATQQPECVTDASMANGTIHPSTQASLAAAFFANAGFGWASANFSGNAVTIDSALTLATIPSGSTATVSPAITTQLLPTATVTSPKISAFTGIWPGNDGNDFVFTANDTSGNPVWGEIKLDTTQSPPAWIIANPPGILPYSGMTSDLAQCLGLFQSQQGCHAQKSCADLIKKAYGHVRGTKIDIALTPRAVESLHIKTENLCPTIGLTTYANSGKGFAQMERATVRLDRGRVAKDTFIGCGKTVGRGLIVADIGEATLCDPLANGIKTLQLVSPRAMAFAFDCPPDDSGAAQATLPIEMILSADGKNLGYADAKGDTLATSQDVNCDASGANFASLIKHDGAASTEECGLAFDECSDDQGNAIPCNATYTRTDDSSGARLAANLSSDFVGSYTFGRLAVSRNAKSGYEATYDAPILGFNNAATDGTCGAAIQSRAAVTISGVDANGMGRVAAIGFNGSNLTAKTIDNARLDCGVNGAANINRTNTSKAILGEGTVFIDACADMSDTTQGGRLFATARNSGGLRFFKANIADLNGTIHLDDADGTDVANCLRERRLGKGRATAHAGSFGSASLPFPGTDPQPSNSTTCYTSGGSGSYCWCDNGTYGYVSGWWIFSYCNNEFMSCE